MTESAADRVIHDADILLVIGSRVFLKKEADAITVSVHFAIKMSLWFPNKGHFFIVSAAGNMETL